MTRVLVAHASKYGSVEEVARYVGAVLRDQRSSLRRRRRRARRATCEATTSSCSAPGSTWVGSIARHGVSCATIGTTLAHLPFAVFAMGPLSDDPAEKEKVRPQLERGLERYPDLEPVATEIFGGVIDPGKMPFPYNRMPAGDHRDWDEIRRFAVSLPVRVPVTA